MSLVGSATGLGMAVSRLAPILRSSGISIERGSRTRSSRTIILQKFPENPGKGVTGVTLSSEALQGGDYSGDTFDFKGVTNGQRCHQKVSPTGKGVTNGQNSTGDTFALSGDTRDTFALSGDTRDTFDFKGVTAETPTPQGIQESVTPVTPLTPISQKNTEDEKTNKLLPIGIWVLHKRKNPLAGKTETRRYQVVDHVSGGEAFQSPEGHYVSHLDPSEYEILPGEFRTVNGISPGSKVRYNELAIAKIERSRAKPGTNDPWDKNWIYEVLWIDDRGWTRLKRCGGGKGKKLVEQMIGCFEVAE